MYTYEKFNLRLFPWFLILLGIIFALTGMYIEASVAGTIGALFCISFSGFSIDPETMRIRHFDRFLWVYIGKWKSINNPQYITVVSIRLSGQRNKPLPMPTAGSGASIKSFKMNLIIDGKERFIPLARGNRIELLTEGLKIARLLKIGLLDHTTSEKHWLT